MRPNFYLQLLLLFMVVGMGLQAQTTYPYNGVYDEPDGHYAFTNATIVTAPGQQISNGTLVIRKGRIVALGADVRIPDGAVEVKLDGHYVYPSFVEPYGNYGLPEAKSVGERPRFQPQMLSNKSGAYAWNEALKPEFSAAEHFSIDAKVAGELRKAGFGTVASHQMDGISRGTAAMVSLAESSEHEVILAPDIAHHLSFRKGKSTQSYPSSLMGSIALLRQTYLDGLWYARQDGETNISLAAWNEVVELPQIFEINSWQDLLRAQNIAEEFGQEYIYKGSGDEYQRIDEVKRTNSTLILPLNFPKAFDVSDPYAARIISLEELRHWERAPGNAAALNEAEIPFVFTSTGLKKPSELLAAVRKSIEHGLSEEAALAALTTGPASLFDMEHEVGKLSVGSYASFLVTSGPIFDKTTNIHHNWVQGAPFVLKKLSSPSISGMYSLDAGGTTFEVMIKGDVGKEKFSVKLKDDKSLDIKHQMRAENLSLRFQPEGAPGFYRLSGSPVGQGWSGGGQDGSGNWIDWSMKRTGDLPSENSSENDAADEPAEAVAPKYVGQLTFPNLAFGNTESDLPQERVLIRNATVWTNEEEGILAEHDVLIENGKIIEVGRNLRRQGARVIDGKGKHLTAGIIDEHSHIALSSVNEGSQASSAEVRMNDVIDATDIDIYRQLAGGVTTSQLLHGSANPIGGQSAIVKLRWGASPQDMVFEGAPGFIKFALGENVKQSNWGDNAVIRYPQTRMGVEQVFDSYFSRAREYDNSRDSRPFRMDLELEALAEILNSERFITCHSYQQGEINMLMEVAEKHNFRVNTFTHILEGYKVADKMADHGAGGSTFSDWWAYKYEVVEAIPYNAAIMHNQGVTVAINSDDAEMARRLNQEAAKSVLFGGVSEEEALKFVTLNPAKLLQIDDRVGSIKVGKDADLVLWSDNPLSIYAIAENTFVDGREYYNRERDVELREALRIERNALIQKSLEAKEAGASTQRPSRRQKRYLHCDSLDHTDHTEHSDHGH